MITKILDKLGRCILMYNVYYYYIIFILWIYIVVYVLRIRSTICT